MRLGLGVYRAIWLACGVVLLSGCLFSPREPESPGAGVEIDYLPRSSPANVWSNLEKSLLATHSPGWEDNISQIEFRYIPDDEARDQFPDNTFDGWDRAREVTFINTFYNSNVSNIAKMSEDGFVFPPPSGNEMTVEDIIYDLKVIDKQIRHAAEMRGS